MPSMLARSCLRVIGVEVPRAARYDVIIERICECCAGERPSCASAARRRFGRACPVGAPGACPVAPGGAVGSGYDELSARAATLAPAMLPASAIRAR